MTRLSLFLLCACCAPGFLFSQEADDMGVTAVRWQQGDRYSSAFLRNGEAYKTISFFDEGNPDASLILSVAAGPTVDCPQDSGLLLRWNGCISILVEAKNNDKIPFDLDPTRFQCSCSGKKPKTLSYVKNGTSGTLLLGNTMKPGERLHGSVFFNGNCGKRGQGIIYIPIALGEKSFRFEFPFSIPRR